MEAIKIHAKQRGKGMFLCLKSLTILFMITSFLLLYRFSGSFANLLKRDLVCSSSHFSLVPFIVFPSHFHANSSRNFFAHCRISMCPRNVRTFNIEHYLKLEHKWILNIFGYINKFILHSTRSRDTQQHVINCTICKTSCIMCWKKDATTFF